jgi:enoyl-CoA hydratase
MITEPNDVITGHEFKALKVAIDGGILTITLNRPERLNAFNEDMKAEFSWLTRRIEANAGIRVIIINAAGERAFCAGADVGWFEQDWNTPRFRVEYRWIHDFFDLLERIEIPVIAAIQGTCACGGLELAMSCDFRISTEDARFGFTEGNINLIPGSGGCSRLIRLIGPGWAKELVLAGEFIDANRAMQVGLVTRVVPKEKLQAEARALADKLVKKAPLALGLAKAIMNTCENIDSASGRILERIGQSVLIKTEDHAEGVRAFREKRPPNYRGK